MVKEFYANLFDPENKSLRQVRVRGKLIKFDAETLNILGDPGGFGAKGEVLRLLQVLPFTPRPLGARHQIVYSRARFCIEC